MLCKEPGTLPGSYYCFLSPSPSAKAMYYYISNVGHFFCEKGYSVEKWYYPDSLVVCVLKGTFSFDIMDDHFSAYENEIVLLDCHNHHKYYADPEAEFMFFHFGGLDSYELCQNLLQRNKGPVFRIPSFENVKLLIIDLLSKINNNQTVSDMEFSQTCYKTLCLLAGPEHSEWKFNPYISDAISFIRTHYSEPLTVEQIASQVNLSSSYFSHLFKEETGQTPLGYLSAVRIDMAKILLKTTKLPICEIAIQLGYSSSSSFNNAFVSQMGQSPLSFRKTDTLYKL